MMRRIQVWDEKRPAAPAVIRKVKAAVRPFRPKGIRQVTDRQGRRVSIGLARVLRHVAFRPDDPSRYRWIPAIVPTLRDPDEIYDGNFRGRRTMTYVAKKNIRDPKGRKEDGVPFVVWADKAKKDLRFSSMVRTSDAPKKGKGAVSPLARIKKGAGKKVYPTPRP